MDFIFYFFGFPLYLLLISEDIGENRRAQTAFSLYILEYCSDKKDLINREQYYFDLLNPTYNICTTAGSTLGRLHTDESKEKISESKLNTNAREDNHFYGKIHSEEAREKMAKSKLSTVLAEEVKEKISASK